MTTEAATRRLRDALGAFPTGVVITTAWHPETGAIGMTMNSFTSISLDPPMILFSIDRRCESLLRWRLAPGYAINVLSSGQERISNQFARARSDKWQGISFQPGLHHAPLLTEALATFECTARQQLDGGDHVMFLAGVDRFSCRTDRSPLVFHRGRYATLNPGPAMADAALPPGWPLSIHY
jgi:flavin reductase (DIM6/NTAB) family NADH-FMN oxidoreductase RutF